MADELTAKLIKLGDMPAEQKTQLWDAIMYSAEHESEFDKFVNKERLDENKTTLSYFRTVLPTIDKTSARYKNGLVEGVTPDPEKMEIQEFTVETKENGWYYPFTNKLIKHSYHDLQKLFKDSLTNLFRSYQDECIADAYLSSLNVADGVNILTYEGLQKLRGILFTNNIDPIDGFYILKAPLEILDKLLVNYKDLVTHTTQKEAIVKGELGELCGFRLVPTRLKAFYTSDNKVAYVAFGKNKQGKFPVSRAAYKLEENGRIITKGLGELGNDPLNQRGSIGLYIDGEAFIVIDDAAAVHGVLDLAKVYSAYDETKRSNLTGTSTSGVGFTANASLIELKVGETFTLAVTSSDGTDITTTATIASNDATIASYATKVVTAAKVGTTFITITSGTLTTYIPVVVKAKTPTAVETTPDDVGA